MAVNLIVIQGKHEGKKIPLTGPVFKIGRGETCHLRPNSERVSREHAEFIVAGDRVTVRDLGSRNGTLLNGKALTELHELQDRDIVQVGPLTFAVTIGDAPTAEVVSSLPPTVKATAACGLVHDTDSWNISDSGHFTGDSAHDSPSGDTVLIPAFTGATPSESIDDEDWDEGYERQNTLETDSREELATIKAGQAPGKKGKPASDPRMVNPDQETSSASAVLRKMMQRLRSSR